MRYSSYAEGDGQLHTRFRSPYAPSIRRTGGQYFDVRDTPGGKAAVSRA